MGDRLRILYLIGTLDLGGAEGQLVELVTGLDRTRFEPVVCCLGRGGPHRATLEAAGIPVRVLGFSGIRSARSLPAAVPYVARLIRFVRSVRPDVMHGVLFWGYIVGAFAARAARTPVVLASRRSLSDFKKSPPYRRLLFLERLANRLTDLVIANSEAVRADTLSAEGLAPHKVVVIRNGVEPERYDVLADARLRAALGVRDAAPVVAVIANFIGYKGHALFLAAWKGVIEHVPGAVALMIGEGPLRGDIQAQAEALGLAESLRFLGARRDVAALLTLTDVVVHPSFQEGFSNAILEAMAAGKAVVASSVGGNPEAVVHEGTGLLVPPGDPRALAAATVSLLQDPGAADKLGAAGRQRVMEQFTRRRMIEDYESLYEDRVRNARGILQRTADVRDRRPV